MGRSASTVTWTPIVSDMPVGVRAQCRCVTTATMLTTHASTRDVACTSRTRTTTAIFTSLSVSQPECSGTLAAITPARCSTPADPTAGGTAMTATGTRCARRSQCATSGRATCSSRSASTVTWTPIVSVMPVGVRVQCRFVTTATTPTTHASTRDAACTSRTRTTTAISTSLSVLQPGCSGTLAATTPARCSTPADPTAGGTAMTATGTRC